MTTAARSNQILDENNIPVQGALVYVYDFLGNLAPLTSDGTTSILNPLKTDQFGNYSYFALVGYYNEDIWYGGRRQWRENNVALGSPGADLALRTDLASLLSGASLVAYSASETVKQSLDRAHGSDEILLGNPTRTAGIAAFGADGLGTLANQREAYTLTGTRAGPIVGRSIEMSDDQTGPASSAGVSTANSASYTQSLVNMRLNWTASAKTGEVDGQNIFIRQGQGDAGCGLDNLMLRNGYGVGREGYVASADSSGNPVKAVRYQVGVVNPRDGGENGMVVLASTGTDLFSGYYARDTATGNWLYPFLYTDNPGNLLWYVRKTDGAMIGGSVTPRVSRGAQIGTTLLDYANVYTMKNTLTPAPLATLGTAAANEGSFAYCNDVTGTPAVGAAVTGGGAAKLLVWSNGTNWLRVV